jgi:hypothetical protein
VYLDAGADPKDFPGSDPAYMELFKKLPPALRQPPPPSESLQAYQERQMRTEGFAFPEAELRNAFDIKPDGTVGRNKAGRSVFNAIGEGQKKRNYSHIRVPVLSFFALPGPAKDPLPQDPPRYEPKDDQERAAIEAFDAATMVYINRYKASLLSGVPGARIVDLPGARHYIFLTREADVLRELRTFLVSLH